MLFNWLLLCRLSSGSIKWEDDLCSEVRFFCIPPTVEDCSAYLGGSIFMALSHLGIAMLVMVYHSAWSDHPTSAWMCIVYVNFFFHYDLFENLYEPAVPYIYSHLPMASHLAQSAGCFLPKFSPFQ